VLKENESWKNFREHSDLTMEFYHMDEFMAKYRSKWLKKFDFPVILAENSEDLEVLIFNEELDTLKDSQELIAIIQERLITIDSKQ